LLKIGDFKFQTTADLPQVMAIGGREKSKHLMFKGLREIAAYRKPSLRKITKQQRSLL
jgi:hypothetical protein